MYKSIKTRSEYETVVSLAQEREEWKEIVQAVPQKFCKFQEEKVVKQREKKSKSNLKQEKEAI